MVDLVAFSDKSEQFDYCRPFSPIPMRGTFVTFRVMDQGRAGRQRLMIGLGKLGSA